MNEDIQKAKEAIDNLIEKLFSDTSVSQRETLDALEELQDSIEVKIDCLKLDMRDDD